MSNIQTNISYDLVLLCTVYPYTLASDPHPYARDSKPTSDGPAHPHSDGLEMWSACTSTNLNTKTNPSNKFQQWSSRSRSALFRVDSDILWYDTNIFITSVILCCPNDIRCFKNTHRITSPVFAGICESASSAARNYGSNRPTRYDDVIPDHVGKDKAQCPDCSESSATCKETHFVLIDITALQPSC